MDDIGYHPNMDWWLIYVDIWPMEMDGNGQLGEWWIQRISYRFADIIGDL